MIDADATSPDGGDAGEQVATAPPNGGAVVRSVGWVVAAYGVFLALLIPVFLWLGRGGWFEHDDWDYLVSRKAGDLGDLMRPHNGHWEAIPVLIYRMLWTMFGLRYRPYQLVSIIVSLVGAGLLLVVILRARTRPWIAVLTVTLLVFFGDAQANVALRVTSITFVGLAVPFGLVQLLLADHDGPVSRRDWFGLAAGFAALLCSGVGVAMVFTVGVAVAIKRGWRIALFHVLAPAIVFAIWYISIGRSDHVAGNPARIHPLPQAIHFASILVTGTFESLTRTSSIGIVLVLAFLGALYLVLRNADADARRNAAIPCAMLAGSLFFSIETGLGRADLLEQGATAVRGGHYMDVVAYLMLPALALVAEALVQRRRFVAPVVAALLIIAIPVNIHVLDSKARATARSLTLFRNTVLLIPRIDLAKHVPRGVQPFNGVASPITVGWLLDAAREGRVPQRRHVTARGRAVATLRISLVISSTGPTRCSPFRKEFTRRLNGGAKLRFRGAGIEVAQVSGGAPLATVSFLTSERPSEWNMTNVGRALEIRVRPPPAKVPAPMICR